MESMSTSLFESVRSGTPFYSELGGDTRAVSRADGTHDGHHRRSADGIHGQNGDGRSMSRAEGRGERQRSASRKRGKKSSGQDDWGKMYPESVRAYYFVLFSFFVLFILCYFLIARFPAVHFLFAHPYNRVAWN